MKLNHIVAFVKIYMEHNDGVSLGDFLGIISIIIGCISIIISIIIYRLSKKTNSQLIETIANRVYEEANKQVKQHGGSAGTQSMQISHNISSKDKVSMRKIIKLIIKKASKNSKSHPYVNAISFPIELKKVLSEKETAQLMCDWKEKKLITWDGALESKKHIYILNGDGLIDDINSR